MTDQSPTDKRTADRQRRAVQAAEAPKAWADYQADIMRTRARTAELRDERLAREAAAVPDEPIPPPPAPPRKRKPRA